MSYILLLITFLLAVFGTFYKSTKTDERGNILHSRLGIPVLTGVGIAVIILLTFSFLTSLYLTKEAREKEDGMREQINVLQKEINRAANPINDIRANFSVAIPLYIPRED